VGMKVMRNLQVKPPPKGRFSTRIMELLKPYAKATSSPSTVKGKFQVSFTPLPLQKEK
jgi:hypothetical protein